jgi:acetyl-CoA carboxylase biotin carboxyl carrier protein
MLEPETVERLLLQLETTDVDEIEIVQGSARIYLRREPGARTASLSDPVPDVSEEESTFAITAPLTGIYYGRPSPEQSAFVLEGQFVEPGQVVGLIETMKLFNEVTADLYGEVTRIAVTDGDLVELGQPLVYVQPIEPDHVE